MTLSKVIRVQLVCSKHYPQLNGSDVTDGDITVVENKGTRDFIKSIAKDAHKIGQDKDLYLAQL